MVKYKGVNLVSKMVGGGMQRKKWESYSKPPSHPPSFSGQCNMNPKCWGIAFLMGNNHAHIHTQAHTSQTSSTAIILIRTSSVNTGISNDIKVLFYLGQKTTLQHLMCSITQEFQLQLKL